jgi:hypothetical protein
MDGTSPCGCSCAVCLLLMLGYPVAFTLAGTALAFAAVGSILGAFRSRVPRGPPGTPVRHHQQRHPDRRAAVHPHGCGAGKSRVAEELLESMAALLGRLRGGLAISVVLVGMLLAASTGIVGATVVTMGLLSLPSMLRSGYDRASPPAPSVPPAPWGRSSRRPSPWCCWATSSPAPTSRRSCAERLQPADRVRGGPVHRRHCPRAAAGGRLLSLSAGFNG